MEYLYAVLLLHSAGKPVTQETLENVVKACNEQPDQAQITMILRSLEGANLDEIIKQAMSVPTASPAPSVSSTPSVETPEEAPTEEAETISDEEAEHGLDALFG